MASLRIDTARIEDAATRDALDQINANYQQSDRSPAPDIRTWSLTVQTDTNGKPTTPIVIPLGVKALWLGSWRVDGNEWLDTPPVGVFIGQWRLTPDQKKTEIQHMYTLAPSTTYRFTFVCLL